MENVPAMEVQTASTEQPADAALPAAETAAETPAPIAAPPGVPMKAPPPSLLTKEEAKENAPAPEIGQLITLSGDLEVVRFTNGTMHLKQKGKDPFRIRNVSLHPCLKLWFSLCAHKPVCQLLLPCQVLLA